MGSKRGGCEGGGMEGREWVKGIGCGEEMKGGIKWSHSYKSRFGNA